MCLKFQSLLLNGLKDGYLHFQVLESHCLVLINSELPFPRLQKVKMDLH